MMAFTFLFVLVVLSSVCSAAHNITIENDTGDAVTGLLPLYEPMNTWTPEVFVPEQGDMNPYNVTGAIAITSAIIFSTGEAWMSLLFQGSAIYVTFVLEGGTTQLNFVLDGEPLQYEFNYTETANHVYYNATVYSNSSLASTGTGPGGLHNLTILSNFSMSFDFAKYTVLDADDNRTTSPVASLTATSSSIVGMSPSGSAVMQTRVPKSHSAVSGGAIAGISTGAVVAIAALVFILYKFAKNSARPSWSILADPFLSQQPKRLNISEELYVAIMDPSSNAKAGPQDAQRQRRSTPIALVEELNSLKAQLARLEAHTQSQATSTLGLQTQIARLEAQLSSELIMDEPPPSYRDDATTAPVPE